MAREILFKAKRIDRNEEWVEGYVSRPHSRYSEKGIVSYYFNALDKNGWTFECIVSAETVCQYTGLCDKNGNKIWENDVCSVNLICDDTEETEKCIVRYGRKAENFKRDLGFYVEWTKTDYLRMDICYWTENKEVEVIGNIFDNPELFGRGRIV